MTRELFVKGQDGENKHRETTIEVERKWFDMAWEKHSTIQSTMPLIWVEKHTETPIKCPPIPERKRAAHFGSKEEKRRID